jgi:hypothetical protein
MVTQFGGGKTHALTLLYHLACARPEAANWHGVPAILNKAGVSQVPKAATAVFVGQQFDPRGGGDGTPRRQRPWGEIAFQLGGAEAFAYVASFDADGIAPGGDTIAKMLPADRPALILVDELMNYVSRYRKAGLSGQLYNFLQNLSEAVRGMDNAVLAVSIPGSEMENGLGDPLFRTAVFEQLGGAGLEGAVTTDIAGKHDAHAVRLDDEAVETIRKARLHQKTATAIFFESNGGVTASRADATLPELRLAVAEPDLDIGNVETVLEALTDTCYFLEAERNRYRFSLRPNLNKILADRRASIKTPPMRDPVRAEVQTVFKQGAGVERVFFPASSGDIPDRAALTLVVMAPEQAADEPTTHKLIDQMTREHGGSGRTFKSALIWAVADSSASLMDDARKLLAWEDIESEKRGAAARRCPTKAAPRSPRARRSRHERVRMAGLQEGIPAGPRWASRLERD